MNKTLIAVIIAAVVAVVGYVYVNHQPADIPAPATTEPAAPATTEPAAPATTN